MQWKGLSPKEKISFTLKLLSGKQRKSKELQQLIQKQAQEDTLYQWPQEIPGNPPKDVYTAILVLSEHGFTDRAIDKAVRQMPHGHKGIKRYRLKAYGLYKGQNAPL